MNDPVTFAAALVVGSLTVLFAIEAMFGIKVALTASNVLKYTGIAMMAAAWIL